MVAGGRVISRDGRRERKTDSALDGHLQAAAHNAGPPVFCCNPYHGRILEEPTKMAINESVVANFGGYSACSSRYSKNNRTTQAAISRAMMRLNQTIRTGVVSHRCMVVPKAAQLTVPVIAATM